MDDMVKMIIKDAETPVFIYDYQSIKRNIQQLNSILPANGNIYYSMKANPNLAICQTVRQFINNIEVSSLGEIECALKSGFNNKNIIFSGPGKTHEELLMAIKSKVKINVESVQELQEINNICNKQDLSSTIMLRINPDFSISSAGIIMSGVASQFGIDMSELSDAIEIICRSGNMNFHGISVFIGSQILDAKTIISNTKEIIRIFLKIQNEYNLAFTELDVGGGFGVSYFNDNQLDIKTVKEGVSYLFHEYKSELKNVKIYFESGRYLLADSGSFITKILYQKQSKGKNYLICDGGFNNTLISSFFTREIRGNFPIEILSERELDTDTQKEYYIAGPLCSPSDIIGSKVILPQVQSGDLLKIKKVGAYGLTFSPLLFISHAIPAEVLINGTNYYITRSRSTLHDLFKNQHELPSGFFCG